MRMMGCEQVVPIYNPLFFCFFFLLFFCQHPYIHAQLCNQEQTSALLQFKHSLSFNKSASPGYCVKGAITTSFPKMESWKNGSNCCTWDGVDCDRTGQVIGLDLSGGWLQGTIHPNSNLFLSFPQLQKLDLACNNFSMSPIPRELTRFIELTHLNLSHSSFSGKVPLELSFLNKLVLLDLSSSNSHDLRLEGGGFELLIKNLSKLRYLDLSRVNMSYSAVPNSLLNLTSLRILGLISTGLNGQFPSGIFHLPYLRELRVGYNEALTGYLPNFMNLSYPLQLLGLRSTGFSGELPDSIGNLKSLEDLFLNGCQFHGSIPTSLWNLTQINKLSLGSNNFSGLLTSSISHLRHLKGLDLSNNYLTGPLFSWDGNLTELEVLYVSNNCLTGPLPSQVIDSLKTINLNGNGFEGPIPKSLVNFTSLEMLDLGRNNFFEKFPHWLGNLPSLHILILHYNEFHGSIVTSTAKSPFPMLRVIDISNNRFTGPLPIEYFNNFEAMKNVDEHFDLDYMGNGIFYYDTLTIVLKGSTTEMKRILRVFSAIDLSSNNFEGEIPEIIGGLNSVRGLNLSHNSLTGHIPKSVGNMMKLEWLDLSSNKLTGEIPQQLTNLNSLGTLNLSQNHLTGPIPRGKQFNTFLNDSFGNNSALCGPPLSNACGEPTATQPPPSTLEEEDSEPESWFSWEVILPGYGFGVVVGVVVGYLMFSFGKPHWLVKMVESAGNRNGKRLESNYIRRLGSRRN